jgi:hypothetical protein
MPSRKGNQFFPHERIDVLSLGRHAVYCRAGIQNFGGKIRFEECIVKTLHVNVIRYHR